MERDPSAVPVRFSYLKKMDDSAATYLHGLTEDRDTRPIRVGLAAHAIALGGTYTVYPGAPNKEGTINYNRQGNAWKAFAAAHAGERIITKAEEDDARAVGESIRRHASALELLEGNHEVEIDWTGIGGRRCQSHVDVMCRRTKRIVDLKITVSANPSKFRWQALNMLYHAQGAFYRDAVEQRFGWRAEEVILVAVSATAPHLPSFHRFTSRALDEGANLCRLWMEQLVACEATGKWPGYGEAIFDLDLAPRDSLLIVSGEEAA